MLLNGVLDISCDIATDNSLVVDFFEVEIVECSLSKERECVETALLGDVETLLVFLLVLGFERYLDLTELFLVLASRDEEYGSALGNEGKSC